MPDADLDLWMDYMRVDGWMIGGFLTVLILFQNNNIFGTSVSLIYGGHRRMEQELAFVEDCFVKGCFVPTRNVEMIIRSLGYLVALSLWTMKMFCSEPGPPRSGHTVLYASVSNTPMIVRNLT